MCAPNGQTKLVGSKNVVASRPPSMPLGSRLGWLAHQTRPALRSVRALYVRRAAYDDRGLAGEMDIDHRHAPERDADRGLRGRRRAQPTDLDVRREANAEVLALLALFRLLTPQRLVVDHLQRLVQRGGVVAGVIR